MVRMVFVAVVLIVVVFVVLVGVIIVDGGGGGFVGVGDGHMFRIIIDCADEYWG